jgi:hypothetical protein
LVYASCVPEKESDVVRYCVIILDGAAGWPLPEYGGRTTLQAASTPNLDRLAREGTTGLAQTVPEGTEPSSSAACTSILGYDPVRDHVGRGAIEAASMGIHLAPDEVALRLNLVTLAGGAMADYSAGHIPTVDSRALVTELAANLDDDVFRLYPGIAYRHILVVTGHPELLDARYTPRTTSPTSRSPSTSRQAPGPIFCSITWSVHARHRRKSCDRGPRRGRPRSDRRVAVLAGQGAGRARAVHGVPGAARRTDLGCGPPQRYGGALRHRPAADRRA